MSLKKEIAKFFCGFEAFHALFHSYLFLSGTTITIFGLTVTSNWNIFSLIFNGILAVILGFYGWKQGHNLQY